MNFHLQTGPGHHDGILVRALLERKLSFTFSKYHPRYQFSRCENGVIVSQSGSRIYDFVKWIVWGTTNRLTFFRKRNSHLDYTYVAYDVETKKRIPQNTNLLFAWAQVSQKTIEFVKRKGGIVVLDYPIPHILTWQKMLREEARHLKIIPRSLFSVSMEKRMLKEIDNADFISVPSEFVRKSFTDHGVPDNKLIYNSYGIDTTFFKPLQNKPSKRKLTAVFVGSVEIRKGVHYLLSAFDEILNDDIELKIVGTIHADMVHLYNKYKERKSVHWLGQQSREETAAIMREADVLVMPSLLEGLSLTLLEAMASGIAVISTTHAGGEGLITNYQEGFVVPIRDSKALEEKIMWCYNNRTTLMEMGIQARKKILSGYRQEDYADRFVEKVLSKQHEK